MLDPFQQPEWLPSSVLRFRRGDVILREGEPGDCMFLIRSGEVELSFRGMILPSVGPGDILGEMGMLDGEERTATAVAASDCELVPISRSDFLHVLRESPDFALDVMRVMAHRLREANLLMSARL